MTVTLKPIGDRVIARPTPKDAITTSGIVLRGTAGEKPREGSVLSAGHGWALDSAKRVEMDCNEYLFRHEGDLLTIVTNGER